ncbi:DUF2752 domain-containing protein [Ascidiimonas sp. W6]|uniref:DUF2752 domain-containing protein n=1 Tax=Ascidiimonas meishanensis TaxID=3128903 RepID=UPI0030EF6BF3
MNIIFLLKIEDYMLPCLNKKFFGFECMGCGIQRAFSLLIQGEFIAAFKMYPGIYPLLSLLGFVLYTSFFKVKYSNKIIIVLATMTVLFIIGNYILKLINQT